MAPEEKKQEPELFETPQPTVPPFQPENLAQPIQHAGPTTPDTSHFGAPINIDDVALDPAEAPTPDDQVWVSKEEYQRLQQTPAPVLVNGVVEPPKLISKLLVAATSISALMLIVGLIAQTSVGSYFIFPSAVILILSGIFTMHDYLQAKKPGGVIKAHKARNVTMFVLALVIVASPVLFAAGFILLLLIVCGAGGCKGT